MELSLDVLDRDGVRVIFTEKQRLLKMEKHAELRDDTFLERLSEAIKKPTFVYANFEKPNRRQALYFEEFKFNGKIRYIKVVLEKQGTGFFLVTAYRPDYVKERGKTALLYGNDNNE